MKRLPLFSNPSRQGFGFYLWRTTPVSDLGGGFLSAARCLSALQCRFLSAIIPPNLKGQAFCARLCIMATTSHQRGFVVNDEIDAACLDLTNFDAEFWVYALGMMRFYSSRITIWDPGGIHSCKAVQGYLIHKSQDHDNSSFSVVGNYLWDAAKIFCDSAISYLVVADKFRQWFHFLFSWIIFELNLFYWSQWQYLPEFFCWLLTTVMHGVCIVLGFESSIRVLDLDLSIRSFVWSVLLLHRMLILRIVILIWLIKFSAILKKKSS